VRPALDPADLPADAVEVGRILDAWGIKGWFKVLSYSASAEALFSSRRWFLLPPDRSSRPLRPTDDKDPADHWTQAVLLRVREAKVHADSVVASSPDIADRTAAEGLRGARVWVPRSSFPTPKDGEYYWVDLIGLQVVNREGISLGQVRDLMATGPQTVLVLQSLDAGQPVERMIPFVSAFVDQVDLQARRITVDWQPDY
jgi:16S rRNA processing protein RimM